MGDRVSIVLLHNGKFAYELYDHWGGRNLREEERYEKLMKGIDRLLERGNDFENFASMLVHFYRQEIAGLDPDDPYNIYLSTEGITLPDNPILVIDYRDGGEHAIRFVSMDSAIEEIENGTAPECLPFPVGGRVVYECEPRKRAIPV